MTEAQKSSRELVKAFTALPFDNKNIIFGFALGLEAKVDKSNADPPKNKLTPQPDASC